MSHATTLMQESRGLNLLKDTLLAMICSVAIALCSNISIPLPFTPVPLTVQNSMILLFSVLLGSRRGGAMAFFFLAQGALGLPVFSGATGGFIKFFSPTGGYLMGYLASAFLTGWLVERSNKKSLLTIFNAMIAGNLVVYLFGALYLSSFIGVQKAFLLGIAPFIAGDLFKILLSIYVFQFLRGKKTLE